MSQLMAMAVSSGDVSQLVQLEMLKQLRSLQKAKGSSDGDSSSEEEGLVGAKPATKLRGIHRLRRGIRNNPSKFSNRFVKHVKARLGVRSARTLWTVQDYSLKLPPRFGQMNSLWRCHWMLANIIQSHIEGNPEFALAFACQSMTCLHQVALDQGGGR